ncbi:MAG: 6-phosphofructokinase [Niameybacter sp.]|uniref:6-phosphofructokinase n=1 Tax=Niameybacter sp. TaxID=2033640 RepID=UPI002FCC0DF7
MLSKGNCIVGQSGGPTVAINASLSGVLQGVLESDSYNSVYGMVNGIEGLLQGKYLNLSETFATRESLDTLSVTPAMFLGSCRFKLPHYEVAPEVYEILFKFFTTHNITSVFYIGGNDSMDTVLKLSSYAEANHFPIRIIGIPKTIDNDLPMTDHTPGFGSAAKFIATTMLEIAHDTYIYNIPSVTIVEIMGRNAGWLTASASLASTAYSTAPDLIYLPEVPFSLEQFANDVRALQHERKNIIVAVSEGIKDADGNYISATGTSVDAFGHKQLCGAGKALENYLKEHIGCKVRSVELNVTQRCAAHVGSKRDIDESIQIGKAGVQAALDGDTATMMCYNRISDAPYKIEIVSHAIDGIANKEKVIPRAWINEAGNDVTEEMITYLRPLIEGETSIGYANGLPIYCDITHLHSKHFFEHLEEN